jgi:hypothetical protein
MMLVYFDILSYQTEMVLKYIIYLLLIKIMNDLKNNSSSLQKKYEMTNPSEFRESLSESLTELGISVSTEANDSDSMMTE